MKYTKDYMEAKVINDNKNDLFNRREVLAEVSSDSTPSHSEVSKLLSEKLSNPEDSIKIKGINGKYGSNIFKIEANVYPSKEDKEKIELKSKREIEAEKKIEEEKKKAEEEAKAAKEAAEKPKEEAPTESETPPEEQAEQKAQEEKTEQEVKEVNQEEKGE